MLKKYYLGRVFWAPVPHKRYQNMSGFTSLAGLSLATLQINSFTAIFQGFYLDFKYFFLSPPPPPSPTPFSPHVLMYWLKSPPPPYQTLKSLPHVLKTCRKPWTLCSSWHNMIMHLIVPALPFQGISRS